MLPASFPLPPAVVDTLLAVLAIDAPLAQVNGAFRREFAGEAATLQAAACCHHMMTEGGAQSGRTHAALPPLRPSQRLSAIMIMFNVSRDEVAAHQTATPAQQQAWHEEQMRRNPCLEPLLQLVDGWSHTRNDSNTQSHTAAPAASLSPQQRIERVFLTRLLLPSAYLPDAPLQGLLRLSQMSASAFLDSSAVIAQQMTLHEPDVLEAALAPVRRIVKENQPHPALLQAMHAAAASAIQAEMRISVPLLSAVIGDKCVTALQAESASASSSAAAHTLPLHVRASPVHWYGSPMVALDWCNSSWEDLLHTSADGTAASPLPPELSWMEWDPPVDLEWNAAQIAPGAASSLLAPLPPVTPTSSATPLVTLLTKACKAQLPAAEKSQLLADLKAGEPSLADGSVPPAAAVWDASSPLAAALQVIPPSRLPMLVERNHDVAIELLRQLMMASQARAMAGDTAIPSSFPPPPSVHSYLAPLVCMDMSLASLEVCKALSVVDAPSPPLLLPPDFLHLFLTRAMASCAKATDKYLQHRHVRLLCAFITTLIRKKIVQVTHYAAAATAAGDSDASAMQQQPPATSSSASSASSSSSSSSASSSTSPSASASAASDMHSAARDVLLVEISAFLVEFASQKEAATLYKLIKTLEGQTNSR